MIVSKDCPCNGCVAPKRYPGCHSKCKEYLDWREQRQKYVDTIVKARRADEDIHKIYKRKRRRRQI